MYLYEWDAWEIDIFVCINKQYIRLVWYKQWCKVIDFFLCARACPSKVWESECEPETETNKRRCTEKQTHLRFSCRSIRKRRFVTSDEFILNVQYSVYNHMYKKWIYFYIRVCRHMDILWEYLVYVLSNIQASIYFF